MTPEQAYQLYTTKYSKSLYDKVSTLTKPYFFKDSVKEKYFRSFCIGLILGQDVTAYALENGYQINPDNGLYLKPITESITLAWSKQLEMLALYDSDHRLAAESISNVAEFIRAEEEFLNETLESVLKYDYKLPQDLIQSITNVITRAKGL
jgi:hypothetical protein